MTTRTLTAAGLVLGAVMALPGPTSAAPVGPPDHPAVFDTTTDVGAPALSFSGRYLAYLAIRRGDDPFRQQLRRLDLETGRTTVLNPAVGGGVAPGNYSRPPLLSADGTRAAYSTSATRLVQGDTNGAFDAFVRVVPTRTTLLASATPAGGFSNGDVGMVSLSKNGRYAVFTSSATDLVPGSATPNTDVFRRDLSTGTTVQVTVRPDGSPSRGVGATTADVSGNGDLVAFASYATDLGQTDGDDGESDLFVRNMERGRTRWLSSGFPVGANPEGVVISPNGRWISTRWSDGGVHLVRVSTGAATTVTTNGYASLGSFSSRLGRFVYMSGGAPYVRDLATGVDTPILVPAGGVVTTVTISGNGRYAAYDWAPTDGSTSRIFRVAL